MAMHHRSSDPAASQSLNVAKELAALERISVRELRQKYLEVFGEPNHSRHKDYLIKRIIWRMQANIEGDLSERARRRAEELANDANLRVTAPRERKSSADAEQRANTVATSVKPSTVLLPGMNLKREYKGRIIKVKVLANGFECDGEKYKSLTAVAKAITGKHWNGFHFFGLRKEGGDQ